MKKVAEFLIKESYQITSLGLVALGKIVEGKVKTGQHICIDVDGENMLLRIVGISVGNPREDNQYFVGLNLSNDDPENTVDLKTLKLQEQTASIFE